MRMRQQELPSKSSGVSIRSEFRIVSGIPRISCMLFKFCSEMAFFPLVERRRYAWAAALGPVT